MMNFRCTDFEEKTFRSYLEHKRLTQNLIHYILYSIGMCDDQTLCLDGVRRVKKFLQSLGRYGNTPFLFPMYGCGEIPQCFCRLSAVFGGIYCLKRPITEIHLDHSLDQLLIISAFKIFHFNFIFFIYIMVIRYGLIYFKCSIRFMCLVCVRVFCFIL